MGCIATPCQQPCNPFRRVLDATRWRIRTSCVAPQPCNPSARLPHRRPTGDPTRRPTDIPTVGSVWQTHFTHGGQAMTNNDVAHQLQRHARKLAEKYGNLYRIRAYRRAAQTVLGLERSVAELQKWELEVL